MYNIYGYEMINTFEKKVMCGGVFFSNSSNIMLKS